jgi:hypothetical protein
MNHQRDEQQVSSEVEASEQSSNTLIMPDESTNYILAFSSPRNPTPEEQKLVADIVILDHRSLHQLRPLTRERGEVVGLLYNAVVHLQRHDAAEGRVILEEAARVYYQHNQTKNRIRYLLGAVTGIVAAAGLGASSLLLARSLEQFITTQLLILLFVFAGMGSITSVLTRISSIDLKDETSSFSVFVSGFSRPLVAIFFALIVYLILDAKILDVKFGNPSEGKVGAIYLVTSFLCGFSERFAQDILARVPFASERTGKIERKPTK